MYDLFQGTTKLSNIIQLFIEILNKLQKGCD